MSFLYRFWGLRKLAHIIENFIFNLWYRKRLGNKVNIYGFPILDLAKGSQIQFGKNMMLISHSWFSEPGVAHPVVIRLMNSNAKLSIGDNVGLSGGGICVQTEVSIGKDVLFGANSFVTDTDFHPIPADIRRKRDAGNVRSKKVVIEDNVFLGMDVIILKGVTIGKNSVVRAGSVVATNIPPNQIWGGNPAVFLRDL
jgi:acetyltransferase-like isoleucine patch superfamily enzyme